MKKIFFIILLLNPVLAYADYKVILNNTQKTYKIYLENLPVGEFRSYIKKDDLDIYTISTTIKTKGLFSYINYNIDTQALFKINNDIIDIINFKMNSEEYKRIRKININFKDRKILDESNIPPENRFKRPAVDDKLKKDIYDPLTAAIYIYKNIYENNYINDFSFKIYEGRRLSYIKVYGVEDIKWQKKSVKLIKFKRIPIAGYTKKELEKSKNGDPEIAVFLDKNNNLIPIYAEFKTDFGNIVIK